MDPDSPELIAVEFRPEMAASSMVLGFDCGPEAWAVVISDWLKGTADVSSAINDIALRSSKVWLYVVKDNGMNSLVGVGGIGPADTKYPKDKGKPIKACCITYLAVDARHQKKGYGQAILDDLLKKRDVHFGELPVLIFVHTDNPAIKWYAANHFKAFGKPTRDGYQKMLRPLEEK